MLGLRIACLRHSFGLSQAALARELNISPSALGMYEQGRRSPPQDILIALSRRLGVSTDYLLTGRISGQGDYAALEELLHEGGIKSVSPLLFLKEKGTLILAIDLEG